MPTSNDLYYRGNNVVGMTGGGTYEAGQITIGYYVANFNFSYNMTGRSNMYVEGAGYNGPTIGFGLFINKYSGEDYRKGNVYTTVNIGEGLNTDYMRNYTATLPLNSVQAVCHTLNIKWGNGVLYRIRVQ